MHSPAVFAWSKLKSKGIEMVFGSGLLPTQAFWITVICLSFGAYRTVGSQPAQPQAGQQSSSQNPASARPVGAIKAISGNTIILTTDAGSDLIVQIQDATKFIRIAPGQKDLKDASSILLTDLQTGDRILVRGKLADDGKTVLAASVIAMKKADIAEKQSHEREEWQKHGLGGLVSSIDATKGTIGLLLPSVAEKKAVAIHLSKDTVLRRYASDSVKFDDAKPAPLDQIKPGDQLRARGTRSPDGADFAADEIVSGTFRNIAGTISAIDASTGSIAVQDLISRKLTTVKVTAESQLRRLPPPMAQRIAARLKGTPPEASSSAPNSSGAGSSASAEQTTKASGPVSGGSGVGGFGGTGRPGGGTADLQQMISRMPASALSELQKGDAVMIVATEGGATGISTVITLLGGVEAILEASPKSSPSTILSPWSLSSGGGAEGATP
jgi:hypothetical protein